MAWCGGILKKNNSFMVEPFVDSNITVPGGFRNVLRPTLIEENSVRVIIAMIQNKAAVQSSHWGFFFFILQ